jgi:FkbM family methyltransferase
VDLIEATMGRRVTDRLRRLRGAVAAGRSAWRDPWSFRGHPDQAFGAVTYAQFGEDLLLLNLFSLLGVKKPRFIDVGAHHPVNISNTALLYLRGARGVNIEPNPNLVPAFARLRPEDVTLNIGVGPTEGVLDFYMIDESSGRNTFDRATAEQFVAAWPEFSIREVRQIPVRTLDGIVREQFGGRYPELVTIDAEGLDYAILEAAHFTPEGPIVICTEAVSGADQDASGPLTALLRQRGYRPFVRTVGNVLFVRAAEAERLAAG